MPRRAIFPALLLLLLLSVPRMAVGACCAWTDRNACATCPTGYSSGCKTEGNQCRCDCAQNASELAAKLAAEDRQLQRYIESNLEQIIRDTQQRGFHEPRPGLRITVTPPRR